MTHMSNYATDRLAPFAFESVLRMLTCYTNLRFKTRNPTELADRYFRMYPQEQTPLWTVSLTCLRIFSLVFLLFLISI